MKFSSDLDIYAIVEIASRIAVFVFGLGGNALMIFGKSEIDFYRLSDCIILRTKNKLNLRGEFKAVV